MHFQLIATAFLCWFFLGGFSLLWSQSLVKIIYQDQKAAAIIFPTPTFDSLTITVSKEGSERGIIGTFTDKKDSTLFYPIIPFLAQQTYLVQCSGQLIGTFTPSATQHSSPTITAIYPSADSLPANLLKFFIRFSEPMSDISPYPYIHLLTAEGDTLSNIFLEQLPALWNSENDMLTIWLDPGRIKRELELNERFGNPLEEAKHYRLVIDGEISSRKGKAMGQSYVKAFFSTPADREKPSVDQWELGLPALGTKDPLYVHFYESMDYLSTFDRIEISCNQKIQKGKVSMKKQERVWIFYPLVAWESGTYTIIIDAVVEDIAGNNLQSVFDRDISQDEVIEQNVFQLSFELK